MADGVEAIETTRIAFPPSGSVVHLIGIGGAGMSAIARVLISLGYKVQGSDLRESPVITRLRSIGVNCMIGHDAANLMGCNAVVYSAAVKDTNPELVEARRRGTPIMRRSDAVSHISSLKEAVAVAGTHGKTSTASMLALVLSEAGLDPSFMVGAELNEAGTNARWGDGPWLVLEADESDGTFLELDTDVAVVTNIDRDHLENWGGSFDRLKEGFLSFMRGASRAVIANRSDSVTASLVGRLARQDPSRIDSVESPEGGCEIVLFGEGKGPGYWVEAVDVSEDGTIACFYKPTGESAKVKIPLIGRHFAVNAAAVVAVASSLGVDFGTICRGLEAFEGVERRMVFRGEASGVAVYDDYAHTPAEVEATMEAGRKLADRRGGRLLAVFQPHLYSRTALYCADFARALSASDFAYLADVYAAREDPIPGVSARLIADEAKKLGLSTEVFYLPSRRQLVETVASSGESGDVVVMMGAGDISAAAPLVLDALDRKSRISRISEG
jgi:UDP-N-acetylmuramate--L-alanine ligase